MMQEEQHVRIFPDNSVPLALFIPNKTLPGTYRAHPQTINAMKKDLSFLETEMRHLCVNCRNEIDLLFWIHCPYCEAPLPQTSII